MTIKILELEKLKGNAYFTFNYYKVRQLEADYKEAIEALVRVQLFSESIYNTEISETAYKGIIEKAYEESWEDIQEATNGN